jgi:hypothetical protein
MARKETSPEPVRSQDLRSVKTKQDRGEPTTQTAAAEDGCPDDSEECDSRGGDKPRTSNRELLSVFIVFGALSLALSACGGNREPTVAPEGADRTARTDALKAGAAALQTSAPLSGMDVYLVGFHPMKDNPSHQMEAHHFCRQVNEDSAQCALFDGNTDSANLTGVEYIISAKLFDSLPAEERSYWHPHNYEILSGQLVAPGLPTAASNELMRTKMNSYGKTFHFWATDEGHKLPLGDARLAWSFNRDGEARRELVERRDQEMGIATSEVRKERQELVQLAKPQAGVDALKGKFAGPMQPMPGVTKAQTPR